MSAKQENSVMLDTAFRQENRSIALIPASPVKWWAGIGFIIIGVMVWTLWQWISSPYFRPAPLGKDPIPDWTLMLIRITDIFCLFFSLYFLYYFIIKPWRKQGELTWDGMLALVFVTEWVLDPICNYFNFTFSYNAYFTNMGSWATFLPGWQSPGMENFPEPLFLMGGIYLWWTTYNVLAACWAMEKCRVWLPKSSIVVHVLIAYLVIVVLDLILEIPACHTGLFAYSGVTSSVSFFAGQTYQFPLYETICMNWNYIVIALLRQYRNDKGESLVERGVSSLSLPKPAKKFMRFLALAGFINTCYFVTYFLPYNWFAMMTDSFPKYPSYMRYEVCGEGTPYACPSREVPIPSKKSLAIPPDDPRLSAEAKHN
jgi:Spirocyclase AveC-like